MSGHVKWLFLPLDAELITVEYLDKLPMQSAISLVVHGLKLYYAGLELFDHSLKPLDGHSILRMGFVEKAK